MSTPLITVVIATYNQAAYIREALESLQRQSLVQDAFQIVIINDGSTDGTARVLREYSSWLTVVEQENSGLVASCNRGLALARGQYLARLDSDDYVDESWLECLSQALDKDPSACCAVPDFYEIRDGNLEYLGLDPENIYTLQACGTMFRTAQLRAIGGFRPFFWEEYDLYLRLRKLGPFIHIARPLYFYRRHDAGMTGNSARRIDGWIELGKEWGFDYLKSAGSHAELDRVSSIFQPKGN